MSEKRLITWDNWKENCLAYNVPCTCYYKDCECSQYNCERWQALPTSTLADVCGNRTLNSMTEDEIRELVELYAGIPVYIKRVLRDNDKSIYVEYVECAKIKTMHIYLGKLSALGKEIEVFKWFIKNGFNVLGGYINEIPH
jgi:hypothetical protein